MTTVGQNPHTKQAAEFIPQYLNGPTLLWQYEQFHTYLIGQRDFLGFSILKLWEEIVSL